MSPTTATPCSASASRGREGDAGHDDDKRGGKPRGDEAQREEHQQRTHSHGDRGRARVIEVADHLDQLRQRVRGLDIDAEHLAELADDEHAGDAVDVAD
jgi:hypothetical protein